MIGTRGAWAARRQAIMGAPDTSRGNAMEQPKVAQKAPYPVEVEAGKSYYWCRCGRSATQPFCDGSHKGTPFTPVAYTPEKSGKAYFCGCKASAKSPLCDGTHNKL
jgi:CDGSH-type Zn-finger protein